MVGVMGNTGKPQTLLDGNKPFDIGTFRTALPSLKETSTNHFQPTSTSPLVLSNNNNGNGTRAGASLFRRRMSAPPEMLRCQNQKMLLDPTVNPHSSSRVQLPKLSECLERTRHPTSPSIAHMTRRKTYPMVASPPNCHKRPNIATIPEYQQVRRRSTSSPSCYRPPPPSPLYRLGGGLIDRCRNLGITTPTNDNSNGEDRRVKRRRGMYKCGRCGAAKKDHDCAMETKVNHSSTQCDLQITRENAAPNPMYKIIISRPRSNKSLEFVAEIVAEIEAEKKSTKKSE